ncbi:MAG: acetoacetate--CoA ligase [Chloroflexota bacterium]
MRADTLSDGTRAVNRHLAEGDLLWEPSESFKSASRIAEYLRWLAARHGLHFDTYDALWRWSVADLEAFWATTVEFFGVQFVQPASRVLADRSMPGARWFEGAELNYAQNVFRHAADTRSALLFQSETRPLTALSWPELEAQVGSVAAGLREMGVTRGDRVVAYMPNIPESVVAFLAAASLGAIWSSCSPDFGVDAVLDRFAQIEPRVLFAVDAYSYGGKLFSRQSSVRALQHGLPTLQHTVLVSGNAAGFEASAHPSEQPAGVRWEDLLAAHPAAKPSFEPVPFDHPLWVLYSSGTTGLPKALVHSHGGVVVEHVKLLGLHNDLRAGERLFWYTSTGWMMWNFVVGGLLVGATPVLFDGNPAYPDLDTLWHLAESARVQLFGTSAAYLMNCRKAGLRPGLRYDLSALQCIGSTGSPLPPEGFGWVYESVKSDLWLASVSGGTDVVSAFVAGSPLLPVHAGELQCRALGASVEAFDERGRSMIDETGELVITQPMPSMPIFLWNDDPDFSRYRASYFDMYPGVWRHGDWIRLTPRGSAVIHGRSDSTLNRLGIRIGTSEVYSAVESLPEIRDSLVLGLELPNGGYYMPLFVVLKEGVALDDELKRKINTTIRTQCSPRHVPDQIEAVPAIPRTLSDKKMEVPVKKLFMGIPLQKAANVGATRIPEALEYFLELARTTSPLLKINPGT